MAPHRPGNRLRCQLPLAAPSLAALLALALVLHAPLPCAACVFKYGNLNGSAAEGMVSGKEGTLPARKEKSEIRALQLCTSAGQLSSPHLTSAARCMTVQVWGRRSIGACLATFLPPSRCVPGRRLTPMQAALSGRTTSPAWTGGVWTRRCGRVWAG